MHTDIAIALAVPGYRVLNRRPFVGAALLLAGVFVPLALLGALVATRRNAIGLGLDTDVLVTVVIVGMAALAARALAIVELWFAAGRPMRISGPDAIALLAAVAMLSAGSVAVAEVDEARRAVEPVFVPTADVLFDAGDDAGDGASVATAPAAGSVADASAVRDTLFDADRIVTTMPPATTAATPRALPTRPDSGVDRELLADVTTVLLLGGDAGPGRSGLRTDSMMIFSLHRPSGRASLVSIPRDSRRLLFPPGTALESRHPYGFDNLTNAVYPIVSNDEALRDAYAVEGVHPGIVALAQGIGYSLDVTIDDYVLVDMQGFLDLIDALGGVTLTLSASIPMPGNVPGARTQYPDRIGPGTVEMDGTTALGYARSRKGDSDFQRTRRQRELLAALARQVSMADVARSFGDVASAVGGTLRTSLTPDELVETLNVIGGETAIVESVGLVPPLVDILQPDFQSVARVVGAVQLALVTGSPSGY